MTVQIVAADQSRRTRWRNGQGWTTELLTHPAPDETGWGWRLSLAESDRPAPFSTFPGIDRELVVVVGPGLRLRFSDGSDVTVGPGQSHRFAGERQVSGTPVAGESHQLNLMWDRARYGAEVDVTTDLFLPGLLPGRHVLVHAVTTSAELVHRDGERDQMDSVTVLSRGQTAVLTNPLGSVSARAHEGGTLVVLRLRRIDSGGQESASESSLASDLDLPGGLAERAHLTQGGTALHERTHELYTLTHRPPEQTEIT